MIKKRIQKIQKILKETNSQGILISNFYNIYYLTGFLGISPEEREAAAYITQDKAYLFLPLMYEIQGKKLEAIKNGDIDLMVDPERGGLLNGFKNFVTSSDPIYFEGQDLKYNEYQKIISLAKVEFKDIGSFISEMRMIKDEEEINNLRKAVEITDLTFNKLVEYLRQNDVTQITELDLEDKIRQFSRELGGMGFGFDPIIACGAGSAQPHYHTSNKKLEKGEPVLFDFGIKYKGYTADLTRNVFLGKATDEYRRIHQIVLDCNKKSIKECKNNVKAEELYNTANEYLKQNASLDLIHGLGHSLGLEIHEPPYSKQKSKDILQTNMVTTIEPGLYLEGKFGVRIEDLVLITDNGCEVLSDKSNKELIEII